MADSQNPYESPQTHDPQADAVAPRSPSDPRRASFDSALDIVKELWSNHFSTLLTSWGTLSAFWLVSTLVTSFAMIMLGLDPGSQQEMIDDMATGGGTPLALLDMFGPGYWALVGLSILLGFVQMGLGIASFGPVRRAWVEGRNLSAAEVLGQLGSRMPHGALHYFIFTIVFTIGAVLCCIPGLVVGYFMLPTFYLVGRGDGIFDSLSTGFQWAKTHVTLLVLFIGVSIGIGLVIACFAGVVSQLTLSMGNAGYMISQVFSWLLGTFFGFAIWLAYAGTMLAIDQAEEHGMGW